MKNRQGLTIAALIIAIVGLSIGFAAFSNTLTINSSASVNPDPSTLNIVWSSSSSSAATSDITPTLSPSNVTGFDADDAEIVSSGKTLSNLNVAFTQPGQSVTYSSSLYVYNAGQLQAQLTGIEFENATGANTYKKCVAATKDTNNQDLTSGEMATSSLVDAACEGITVSVTIGTASNVTPTTVDKTLNYQLINAGSSLTASVTISYNGSYVDGPMEVTIGDIKIHATSAVNPNAVVTPSSPSTPSESCTVTNVKSFGNSCVLSEDNDSSGTVTQGDKVTCGTEGFYVIENPSNGTVKMLTEWNLNISDGILYEFEDEEPYYTSFKYCSSTEGYQDEHVRGFVYEEDPDNLQYLVYDEVYEEYLGYGIVPFVNTYDPITKEWSDIEFGYWAPGGSLNTSVYKQNNNGDYPAYVYDNNSDVYPYVNRYVGYINSQISGANAQGRLIKTSELEVLGCSMSDFTCKDSPASAPSWVYHTSYWSGSADGSGNVWNVGSLGSFNSLGNFDDSSSFGVRPVIEISSSVIQTS